MNNELNMSRTEPNISIFGQLNKYIDSLTKNNFTKKYNCSDRLTAKLIKSILNSCIRQYGESDPSVKNYKFKAEESQLFMLVKKLHLNDGNLIDPKLLENIKDTAIRFMSSLAENWVNSDEAIIDEIILLQNNVGETFVPAIPVLVDNSDPVLLKTKGLFFSNLFHKCLDRDKDKKKLVRLYINPNWKALYGNKDCVQAIIDRLRLEMLPKNIESLFNISLGYVRKNIDYYEDSLNQLPVELIEEVRNKNFITLLFNQVCKDSGLNLPALPGFE